MQGLQAHFVGENMAIQDVLSHMCRYHQRAVVVLSVTKDDILGVVDVQGNFNRRLFHDCGRQLPVS